MKVRLAIAAAVLALGVTAFTPTPAAAAEPSGTLLCQTDLAEPVTIPFGPLPPPPDQCVEIITLRQAVQLCRAMGGHPVLVVINGGTGTS